MRTLPGAVVRQELQSVFPSSATLTDLYVVDNLSLVIMQGQGNAAIFPEFPAWESEVKGLAISEVLPRFSIERNSGGV